MRVGKAISSSNQGIISPPTQRKRKMGRRADFLRSRNLHAQPTCSTYPTCSSTPKQVRATRTFSILNRAGRISMTTWLAGLTSGTDTHPARRNRMDLNKAMGGRRSTYFLSLPHHASSKPQDSLCPRLIHITSLSTALPRVLHMPVSQTSWPELHL